jgi:tetratricopeptide (TPR) repeat protein
VLLNNIGFVYFKLQNFKRALEYFTQAITLKKKTNDLEGLQETLVNICLCHAYLQDLSTARIIADSVVRYCPVHCSGSIRMRLQFANGMIHLAEGNYKEAQTNFLNSLTIARDAKDTRGELDNIVQLMTVCYHLRQADLAIRLMQDAEAIAKDSEHPAEMSEIYGVLLKFPYLRRNVKQYLQYQAKYMLYRDRILSDSITINLMRIEADFLDKENTLRIRAQDELLTLNEKLISQQRNLTVVISLAVVTLFLLAILIVLTFLQRSGIQRSLDRQVAQQTMKLMHANDDLVQVVRERQIVLERTIAGLKGQIASVKGLCLTGQRDLDDAYSQNKFSQVTQATDNICCFIDKIRLATNKTI